MKSLEQDAVAVYSVGRGGLGVPHRTDAHTGVHDGGSELALNPELYERAQQPAHWRIGEAT